MAKLTTTTQEIQYTLQQQRQEYLNEKEKREIKKQYNAFLKATIKENLQYYYIKNNNYNDIYNYIILNSDNIKNKIIEEIEEENEQQKKEIYIFEKQNDGNYKEIKTIIYLWDDFDIINDIDTLFFKVLKQVNEEFKQKEKAETEETLKRFKNFIIDLYNNYGYIATHKILYQKGQNIETSEEIANNEKEKEIILQNYYIIINKIDSMYKKTETTRPKSKNKKGLLIGLSFVGGVVNGFKKSIK